MSLINAFTVADHERFMRAAIDEGRQNPAWPFGAVIVDADSREIVARGFNQSQQNMTFHGEIVAFNNHVAAHGHERLGSRLLYTTAEPCPMCMGALIWAGIGAVVFGTSIGQLMEQGIRQITITAAQVCAQAPFYQGYVVGGILSDDTDQLFREGRSLRDAMLSRK